MRLLVPALILGLVSSAHAEFRPYPGAQDDPQAAANSQKMVDDMAASGSVKPKQVSVLTSTDSFEKVLAFYQTLGKEWQLPASVDTAIRVPDATSKYERELPSELKLGERGVEIVPSGLRVKQVFLILDGADSLSRSRDWLIITHPQVEQTHDGPKITYGNIRKVTVIERVQAR